MNRKVWEVVEITVFPGEFPEFWVQDVSKHVIAKCCTQEEAHFVTQALNQLESQLTKGRS